MNFEALSQRELATILDVDPSSIGNWTRLGMPYTPAPKGQAGSYSAPVCINWKFGHTWAKRSQIKLTPLEKVAIGWLTGAGEPDMGLFAEVVRQAGAEPEAAPELLGFARGLLKR
ncbi:hypothetical protein Q6D67_20345 [Haliea sp. E1-2-M8]|uniref:hypothetical protein n=1 Tax=Haliea sp. E1-2-M8 TaxID=3064706 RepID=UPI002715B4B0|nr:hypothetical protein [Haliea sp. E1-2-M8]MDO8864041.1 hypothetical protein [Haliea sp. E1-2-M8]